jgi:hypothetical protein
VYGGLLALVLFGLHTGWRLPNGTLETVLAVLFCLVSASGLLGLGLSQWLPRRLAARGEEVLFERIPILRRRLQERADALVVETVHETQSSALADFHAEHVKPFLEGSHNTVRHLVGSPRPRQLLLARLDALTRYLSEKERAQARALTGLIEQKDDLDYHHALQGALKLWLFAHVPLTYSMLLFVVLHAWIAHAFATVTW